MPLPGQMERSSPPFAARRRTDRRFHGRGRIATGCLGRSSPVCPGRCGRPATRCSRWRGGCSRAIRRLPSVPPRSSRPWIAIWPGPPSNSCNTFERALSASANGPPGSPAGICSVSSTKNWPVGRRRRGLAHHRLEGPHHVAVAVDPHAAGGEVDDDAPARHELAGALLGDPAGRSVGATGKHHLQPPHPVGTGQGVRSRAASSARR